MGLANASVTFQAVMNQIFAPYLRKFVITYLDDILVYGRSPQEHARNLETVLKILKNEELYAKLSKCAFNKSEVKFLGHIIGLRGISVNPTKVAVVQNWTTPNNTKQVQQFLVLTNYFRKFIQGYSAMATPQSEPTKIKGRYDKHPMEQRTHGCSFIRRRSRRSRRPSCPPQSFRYPISRHPSKWYRTRSC